MKKILDYEYLASTLRAKARAPLNLAKLNSRRSSIPLNTFWTKMSIDVEVRKFHYVHHLVSTKDDEITLAIFTSIEVQ